MSTLCSLSDADLVERLPVLVKGERHAMLDVVEHLVEMERRKLYLRMSSATSLHGYCISRLGYAQDAALKRHRVAMLALQFPQVLDELRAGTIHFTALFLLSRRLTEANADALLGEARGKSKRQIEELIARWFPRADVPASLTPVSLTEARAVEGDSVTCSGAGDFAPQRLELLSPTRLRVEFTGRAELYDEIQKARELLSHAVPSGDLGELFERAIDALIEQETRRRFGAGKPRKERELKPGSRHVPVAMKRAVWARDGSQCTFVDGEGHRCVERRFLTIEHRMPFASSGAATLENLCLLCRAHNLESARRVFGAAHIEAKMSEKAEPTPPVRPEAPPQGEQPLAAPAQAISSLRGLGFGNREASAAIGHVLGTDPGIDVEQLLRRALLLLVPKAS